MSRVRGMGGDPGKANAAEGSMTDSPDEDESHHYA
jgi:hypothetical protein